MRTNTKTFSEVLTLLADENEPLSAAIVYGLSALNKRQVSQVRTQWPHYPAARRRKLIQHLNEVSEANFEMDFKAINYIALEDPHPEVRKYAIEGLWEDENPALLHKLIKIAEHDPALEPRIAAVIEIGRFILLGEYGDISEADAQAAQQQVLNTYHNTDDLELRRRALEAISKSGHPAVPGMIESCYNHSELPMQMSAVFAMGHTCDTRWAGEIIQEMQSSIPEMQFEAARAAGTMQLSEAVTYLERLINNTDDTEILEIAIWALGEIGGDHARNLLDAIMARAEEEEDEEILAAAQDAYDAASLPGDFLLFDFEP